MNKQFTAIQTDILLSIIFREPLKQARYKNSRSVIKNKTPTDNVGNWTMCTRVVSECFHNIQNEDNINYKNSHPLKF